MGGRRSSAEDARIEAAMGVGSGEGLCPFSENLSFSSQNGVIWCRWRWQRLRLATFRSSAEGKKIKHLSKYRGVVNTGRPLQVKYWGSRPLQPLWRWHLCKTDRQTRSYSGLWKTSSEIVYGQPPVINSINFKWPWKLLQLFEPFLNPIARKI